MQDVNTEAALREKGPSVSSDITEKIVDEAIDLAKTSLLPEKVNLQLGAEKRSGCLSRVLIAAAILSPLYFLTGKKEEKATDIYPVPELLQVNNTTLPTVKIAAEERPLGDDAPKVIAVTKEGIDLSKVDLSGNFEIETDRYRLVKDEDMGISRVIGHVTSCISKILFLDADMGAGLDEDHIKGVIAMLENNPKLEGVYVRVNHNAVWQDCARLFNDPKVVERNSLPARIFFGLPATFMGELFAELSRGDYYNPMTQTAVLYSNVRSISAHEFGHHQDHQRFDSDWWYQLARPIPPVMLYQEYQASMNAKNDMLVPEDQWQFNRYLIPAFLTYLVASYAISKKRLMSMAEKGYSSAAEDVNALHVARHMGTTNGSFLAGLGAAHYAALAGVNPVLGAAALVGTWAACQVVADKTLKHVVPYPHEDGVVEFRKRARLY